MSFSIDKSSLIQYDNFQSNQVFVLFWLDNNKWILFKHSRLQEEQSSTQELYSES